MMVFLAVLTVGFVYEWKKGALEWIEPRCCKAWLRIGDSAAATGILDPSTGRPVGANDLTFLEVNPRTVRQGFFVTATDDLITWRARDR